MQRKIQPLKGDIIMPDPVHGFERVEIQGRDSFYQAVALFCGKDNADLRAQVVSCLTDYNELPPRVIDKFFELNQEIEINEYINAVAHGKDCDEVQIETLMHVLERPIVIIGADQKIQNPEVIGRFEDRPPVFVYSRGDNHYDGLSLTEGMDSCAVLNRLIRTGNNHNSESASSTAESAREQKDYSSDHEMYLSILKSCVPPELLALTYQGELRRLPSARNNVRSHQQNVAKITAHYTSFPCNQQETYKVTTSTGELAHRLAIPYPSSVASSSTALTENTGQSEITFYIPGTAFSVENYEIDDLIASHLVNALNTKVMHMDHRKAPHSQWPCQLVDICDSILAYVNEQKQEGKQPIINIAGYSSGGLIATLAAIVLQNFGIKVGRLILFAPLLDLGGELRMQPVEPDVEDFAKFKPYLPNHFQQNSSNLTPLQQQAKRDTCFTPERFNQFIHTAFGNSELESFENLRNYSPVWFRKECFNPDIFPQTTIITGENDYFRPDIEVFFERLRDANCNATKIVIPNSDHTLFWNRIFPLYLSQPICKLSDSTEVVPSFESIQAIDATLKKGSSQSSQKDAVDFLNLKLCCQRLLANETNKSREDELQGITANTNTVLRQARGIALSTTKSIKFAQQNDGIFSPSASRPRVAVFSKALRNDDEVRANNIWPASMDQRFSMEVLKREQSNARMILNELFRDTERHREFLIFNCSDNCGRSWFRNVAEESVRVVGTAAGAALGATYGAMEGSVNWVLGRGSFSDSFYRGFSSGRDGGRRVANSLIELFLIIIGDALRAVRENQFKAFIETNVPGGALFCYLLGISLCQKMIKPNELKNYILLAINQSETSNNQSSISKLIQSCVEAVEIFLIKKDSVLDDLNSTSLFSEDEGAQLAKNGLIEASNRYQFWQTNLHTIEAREVEISKLERITNQTYMRATNNSPR